MADKLINLREFNDAVSEALAGTAGLDSVIDALAPKPQALFIDVHTKPTAVGVSTKALFAHACNFRVHSATPKNPERREAVEKVIEGLRDHSSKISDRAVKPYGRKK